MAVKVVVLGDVLAQLTVQADKLPRPHQHIPGDGFAQAGAGHGAQQAIAAARLGASVTFIGRVGDDVNGALVRQLLAAAGVGTDAISTDATHPTGVHLRFSDATGRAMGAIVTGANAHLTEQHIKAAEPVIAAADVLVTQLALPTDATARALELARQHGVRTVLKPTPFTTAAERLLHWVDVLTPNETELRALAQHTATTNTPPGQVHVCTLGAAGAQWFRQQGGEMQTGRMPGFTVRAVDVAGAGGVFSAALAVRLAEAAPLPEAIRFANGAGALATTVQGGWPSAPSRGAITALITQKQAANQLPQTE